VSPPPKDPRQRILHRMQLGPGGCWLWSRVTPKGYGIIETYRRGRGKYDVYAHRYAYEAFVGAIPGGLDIDHTCFVRNCVNPEHLEPVTRAENLQRARERRSTNSGPR